MVGLGFTAALNAQVYVNIDPVQMHTVWHRTSVLLPL